MHPRASQYEKGPRFRIGGVLRWIRRGLLWLTAAVIALAAAGALYQAIASGIDERSIHPAPGELVDVDGHRLHMSCLGEGSPTVVLEAGSMASSIEWSAWVQPSVANTTRVCAYDRAGIAWSEAGSGPRNATRIVGEFHTLLKKAGIEGPYVLVGHSMGGLYSLVYADRYPKDVAGMVLVDSSHPDQFERMGMESSLAMNRWASVIGPPVARMGLPRLFDLFPPSAELPPPQREQSTFLYYTTPHLVAEFEELGAIPEVLDQARKTGTLGEKPLAVVSAGERPPVWLELQDELMALSSESTQRLVEGASHESLVLEQRHARYTSEEIVRMVEAVRSKQLAAAPKSPRGSVVVEQRPPRDRR